MIGKKYGKEEFLKSSLSPMSAVGFCENVEYNVWKYLMRQGHNYLIQLKVQIQMVWYAYGVTFIIYQVKIVYT